MVGRKGVNVLQDILLAEQHDSASVGYINCFLLSKDLFLTTYVSRSRPVVLSMLSIFAHDNMIYAFMGNINFQHVSHVSRIHWCLSTERIRNRIRNSRLIQTLRSLIQLCKVNVDFQTNPYY